MQRLKSRSLFSFMPASIIAVCFGLLDASAWIVASQDNSLFSLYYAIAVPCKAVILLILARTVRRNNAMLLWPFCFAIGIVLCVSIISGNTNFEGVVQPCGVLISLAMTIVVLSEDNITAYMKAFGLSCFLSCLTFLFELNFVPLNTSGVWEVFGRYTFIGGTQPNLGGEILFTGFIALCIARLNIKLIVAVFVAYLIVLNLIESRTAMFCILIAFLIFIYIEKLRQYPPLYRVTMGLVLALLVAGVCAINSEKIMNLFLLEDKYRGIGTGFVGREDNWNAAWTTFLQYPFFGVGFGYFRHDVITPHSMWLGMLSTMGLMSVFMLATIIQNYWRIYLLNREVFMFLLTFIPMTILNDRFLNLNPYPFLLFVLLFLPRAALTSGVRTQGFSASRRRSIGARIA